MNAGMNTHVSVSQTKLEQLVKNSNQKAIAMSRIAQNGQK